jgi:two-component system chemotaxis response regulator CheB
MSALDARVVVVTKDSSFFNNIRGPLANDAAVSLVINVPTAADAENKFAAGKPNVLLIDTDSGGIGTKMQIEGLTTKHLLYVIFTGMSPIKAAAYTSANAKEFLLKPGGAVTHFVNDILLKIRPFIMKQDFRPGASAYGMRDLKELAGHNTKIVLIASSTGGPDALEHVFKAFPADCPPVLVVQHMPSGFTKLFAERLNNFYPMTIREAATNDYVKSGQILIAPADMHMALAAQGDKYVIKCFVGEKIHAVMPAADVMFESAGPLLKHNAIGVVLTGMGSDGAKGLMQMHMLGAKTICQDQATSVVYGMPKAAYDLGAVDYKLPLDDIGRKILSLAGR